MGLESEKMKPPPMVVPFLGACSAFEPRKTTLHLPSLSSPASAHARYRCCSYQYGPRTRGRGGLLRRGGRGVEAGDGVGGGRK